MARCKECGADIIWVKSPRGKWIPCNDCLTEYKAGDAPDYEDYVVDSNGEVIRCTFDFQCNPDGLARIPHWATCPHSDKFREKK